MKCTNCGSDINPEFKHAISKNECPACGGQIMDEETMALIEDMENTILNEAAVRSETARSLAMTLVARYDMALRTGVERVMARQPIVRSEPHQSEQIKIANSSTVKRAMSKDPTEEEIVRLSELMSEEVSENEREEIMAEVVKEKMNMVESSVFPEELATASVSQSQPQSTEADAMANALFGNKSSGVLEEERMLRLAKQQKAIQSGSGGFRRGS